MILNAIKPVDLSATGGAPRPKSEKWEVGDIVNVGSTRWIIRTITGDAVELEAASTLAGIWWRTTLPVLPVKVAAS